MATRILVQLVSCVCMLLPMQVNAFPDLSAAERARAFEAARDFVKIEFPGIQAKNTMESISNIEPQKHNPTYGSTAVVVMAAPRAILTVELTNNTVVSAFFPGRSPRSMSSRTTEGVPVAKETMYEELVKCTESLAFESSMRFLHEHFGPAVLDEVELVGSGLEFHGSYFVYRFSWREVENQENIALRFESIRAEVDPESCQVYRFSRVRSVPSSQPVLTAGDAGHNVRLANPEVLESELRKTCLIELVREDGTRIPSWVLSYQRSAVHGPERQQVGLRVFYVHGGTGRVYDSATELLARTPNAIRDGDSLRAQGEAVEPPIDE